MTHDKLRELCKELDGPYGHKYSIEMIDMAKGYLSLLDEVERLRTIIKTCPVIELETQLKATQEALAPFLFEVHSDETWIAIKERAKEVYENKD